MKKNLFIIIYRKTLYFLNYKYLKRGVPVLQAYCQKRNYQWKMLTFLKKGSRLFTFLWYESFSGIIIKVKVKIPPVNITGKSEETSLLV